MQEGTRPTWNVEPINRFMSHKVFAGRSSNSKVVRAPSTPPRFKHWDSVWEQLEQCHNMYKMPLSKTVDEEYTLEKSDAYC